MTNHTVQSLAGIPSACPYCKSTNAGPVEVREPELCPVGFDAGETGVAVRCTCCGARGPVCRRKNWSGAVREWNQVAGQNPGEPSWCGVHKDEE